MLEIAKITNCIMNFEATDGKRGIITIPNICESNLSITNSIDGTLGIDLSLNVSPSSTKELFRVEMENDKESEEKMDKMEMRYTVISCIFPSNSDEYYSDSKVYHYIVDGPPENCSIKKNTLFQVFEKQHKVKYNGAKLLCTDITRFKCIQDIQDYYNRVPYTIPIYEVCGQFNVDELESSNEASFKREYEGEFSQADKAMNSFVSQVDETLNSFVSQCGFISYDNEGTAVGKNGMACDEAFAAVDKMIEDNKENINTLITEEENSMFDNIVKGLEFGAIKTNDISYTFNGICFRNADGNYASLNPDGTFTNVYDMVMDIPIYVMPVGKDQIKVGDIIKHFDKWVMVAQIDKTTITALDPWTREIRVIIPEKSIFGFDYYTKVIDIFSGFGNSANQNSPFGNMLPFLMMSKDSDIDPMMFMLMSGQNFGGGMNPMMMYMMMSKNSGTDSNDKILPLMMMMNNGMFGGNGCNCNGDCKCDGTANSSESAPYSFYYDTGAAAENSGDDSQNSKKD